MKNRITSDPNNLLLNNWTQATPFCNWYGVTCGTRHTTRVTSLRLLSAGLSGTIPKEIGNLSFLVYLEFGNNSFRGDVPQEIGFLRRLRHLSLQYNELTGPIPQSFGSLGRLQLLDISNNNLVGTIPFSIFNISSLRVIDFNDNQLRGTLQWISVAICLGCRACLPQAISWGVNSHHSANAHKLFIFPCPEISSLVRKLNFFFGAC
ncbi:UNVERIFIED_CONTAM: hypothetical protein Sradi_4373100 [Sesamum radiatum]|uniref:Leucine-rich repeat-containing N-terminal plant-type domain-containing protein n=1 Tax=Sesamum radiatum TaxID=300843 RepID=A0AAW2NPR2_SESRA